MSAEDKFQGSRKKMRAVADMLDILARFEDPNDRNALIITVVSVSDEKAEKLVDSEMRKIYGREGKPWAATTGSSQTSPTPSLSILEDLTGLWAHMDEVQPVEAAFVARGMVEASSRLLVEGELTTLGEAMAQAVLLLTMVRETCLENDIKRAEAS